MENGILKRLSTRYAKFAVHDRCRIFRDRQVYPPIVMDANEQVFWFDNNRGVSVIEYEDKVTIAPIKFVPIDPPNTFDTGSDDIEPMPFYRLKPMYPLLYEFHSFQRSDGYVRGIEMEGAI